MPGRGEGGNSGGKTSALPGKPGKPHGAPNGTGGHVTIAMPFRRKIAGGGQIIYAGPPPSKNSRHHPPPSEVLPPGDDSNPFHTTQPKPPSEVLPPGDDSNPFHTTQPKPPIDVTGTTSLALPGPAPHPDESGFSISPSGPPITGEPGEVVTATMTGQDASSIVGRWQSMSPLARYAIIGGALYLGYYLYKRSKHA